MIILNEELFDDVIEVSVPDIELDIEKSKLNGPETPEDRGLTEVILSLINDENDTIKSYNSFIANLENYSEFIPVINDIINEEMNHVGMLQTLLQRVSPNTENIESGRAEADRILNTDIDSVGVVDRVAI